MEITDKSLSNQKTSTTVSQGQVVNNMITKPKQDESSLNKSHPSQTENQFAQKVQSETLPIKFTPVMKILLIVLGILFLLLFISMLLPKKTALPLPTPTPSPLILTTPSPQTIVSEFAKSDIFVLFEQQIATVAADLNAADLQENKLNFPLLDMNVNFNK